MSRYLGKRIVQGIIALFLAVTIIFFLGRVSGNPLDAMLSPDATKEQYEAMSKYLGLDKPILQQYLLFVSHFVRGELGDSIFFRKPVVELITKRFPATFQLSVIAFLLSILLAVPVGVLAAIKRGTWHDAGSKGFAVLGQAMPKFWLGILLIEIFAVQLGVLPAGGYGGIQYWVLPATTQAYHSTAAVLRLTRSSMLDVLGTDYVRLARIKGISELQVILKHALRNAMIPVATYGAVIFAHFLMGSVVTETVFTWPGIGLLAQQAVMNRDFPLMQGLLVLFVGLFVIFNLLVDILYLYLDPRIRYVRRNI